MSKSISKKKRFLIAALFTLYFFSNPFIYKETARAWEMRSSANTNLENYEVAVILGGIVHQNGINKQLDFAENADRVLAVLPLYFDKKVKKILISGGSGSLLQDEVEADLLADYLISIGVKKQDIWRERKSRNTYENALYSAELIREKKVRGNIMLATSAMHMKRAYLCFEKQSLSVTPFSVDAADERKIYFSELFIPEAQYLEKWYQMVHEWVGIVGYKIVGYC